MPDIQVVITPENATNKAYTVISDKPEIVSVDENNKCKAHAAGKAELTFTTEDGGFVAKCVVTVKEPNVPVEEISVDPTEKEVTVGDSFAVGE